MGERVAISFIRYVRGESWEFGAEDEESVTIYSHYGGDNSGSYLVLLATNFIKSLLGPEHGDPISRREPDALVPAFIQTIPKDVVDRIYSRRSPSLDWGHW